ncbi:MAG: hypothetical protein WCV59_02840 [Parcubacteria group bacterium]|jgi:hypothetical protein
MKKILTVLFVVSLCFAFLAPPARAGLDEDTANAISGIIGGVFGTIIENENARQQQRAQSPTPAPTGERVNFNFGRGAVSVTDFCQFIDCNVDEPCLFENESYGIYALKNSKYPFGIIITDIDIETSRSEAEKKFMELLDIGPADACKLPVLLFVDKKFNCCASDSSTGYGLSFCRIDGKRFPAQAIKDSDRRIHGKSSGKRR